MRKKRFLLLTTFLLLSLFVLANRRCQNNNGDLKYLDTRILASLRGVDWKPDDSYALIVGDGIYKYDGKSFKDLSKQHKGNAVDWKPDGSYALIVGDEGSIIKFDGVNFSSLLYDYPDMFTDVSWEPDGAYALIVGYGGRILKYDGSKIEDISLEGNYFLEGVDFKPDGTYALISGIYDYAKIMFFTYDGFSVKTIHEGEAVWPGHVAWDNFGEFALIPEDWGHVLKYDEKKFEDLDTGMWQKTDGLTDVDFSPTSNAALIVGAWAHSPLKPFHTVMLYENGIFTTLLNEQADSALLDVSWRNDGEYALIVGEKGNALQYMPSKKN